MTWTLTVKKCPGVQVAKCAWTLNLDTFLVRCLLGKKYKCPGVQVNLHFFTLSEKFA